MDDIMDYTCGGNHPDARTLTDLFCRKCGLWKNGQRVGHGTTADLVNLLEKAKGEPVKVHVNEDE